MSSNPTGPVLLIFAKSPASGEVKTRLSPVLNPPQRVSLHVALLRDTIEKARATDLPVTLYLTASDPLPFPCDLPVETQNGETLGERMLKAVTEQIRSHSRVVIIGTDSPTFSAEEILEAVSSLDHNDVVLGPCDDGGYYLIAMKEPVKEAFQDIPWGTENVLNASLVALKKHKVHLLRSCFDVDRPADLIRLRTEVDSSSKHSLDHTRAWLRKWTHDSTTQ